MPYSVFTGLGLWWVYLFCLCSLMVWFCVVGAMLVGVVSMSPLGGCCWFICRRGLLFGWVF